MAHRNARLGPAGRRELARLMIEIGMSERQAAACLSVSPCTAHRWKQRWLTATAEQRASGCWALDRSSRPHRSPTRTAAAIEERVCAARERTGWGPRLIASEFGVGIRRCTRFCAATDAHGRRASRARKWSATSGRVRATCCTWTSSAIRAFGGQVTPSRAIDARPGFSAPTRSATTTSTPSSTTIRGWPTASCSPTSAVRP
jgi:transposase